MRSSLYRKGFALALAVMALPAVWVEARVEVVTKRVAALSGSGGGTPLITADGAMVVFTSSAIDLVEGMSPRRTSTVPDVFARRWQQGVTLLVSRARTGSEGGSGSSRPTGASTDGRYVVFTSNAANLVNGLTDNNLSDDVFVRDNVAGTTAMVSVASSGTAPGNGPSDTGSITPDGRYVVFRSRARNLVAGIDDTNTATDVFVRDLVSGETALVSAAATGAATGNGASEGGRLSADGRYVAFESTASNLVANGADGNGSPDVFVRDLVEATTTLISRGAGGASSADGSSRGPRISASGDRIAFTSTAQDLVGAGLDGNGVDDVYLRDRGTSETHLVSATSGDVAGNGASTLQGLSADGAAVLYLSSAGDLVESDGNSAADVFVTRWQNGTTFLVSASANGGSANAASAEPVINAAGDVVAFTSLATDLVDGFIDANGSGADVFVRRLGANPTQLVSAALFGGTGANRTSSSVSISADGRRVAFASAAGNLTSGAAGAGDVYVRDLDAAQTHLVSAALPTRGTGNGEVTDLVSTPNGRHVVFVSRAADLIAEGVDLNAASDVFRYDRLTGTTELVSVGLDGRSASGFSGVSAFRAPSVSADGRFVLFLSAAPDLVPGFVDGNGSDGDVYLRDMQTGVTRLVSINAHGTSGANGYSETGSVSDDGRFVLFGSGAADVVPGFVDGNGNQFPLTSLDLYVRDMQLGQTRLVSVNTAGTASGNRPTNFGFLSRDGARVVFESRATDLVAGVDANGNDYDIFVRELAAQTTRWVTRSVAANRTADFESTLTFLSRNGRFVSFFSFAQDLVAGFVDGNDGFADTFVRDLQMEQTALVTINAAGTASGNGLTQGAGLTEDGHFAIFTSDANDLVTEGPSGAGVLVRDLTANETRLVSVNRLGTGPPTGSSSGGPLTNDARYAAFRSNGNVVDNVTGTQLYWRDLAASTSRLVTRSIETGLGSNGTPTDFGGLRDDGQLLYFHSDGSDLVEGDLNLSGDLFAFEPIDDPTRTPTTVRSPTPTPTASAVPSSTAVSGALAGDCNRNGEVTVEEVVAGVRIVEGLALLATCPEADADGDQEVTQEDLKESIAAGLSS